MKISEAELIRFIENLIERSRRNIKYLESQGIGQNTPGVGIEVGRILAGDEILSAIKEGVDDEDF